METPTEKEKVHEHDWKEDPMFADGTVMMFCGSPSDIGQETRVLCECGAVDYVPKNVLKRVNLLDHD